MHYGYTGKILHVSLADSRLSVEEPSEDFYRLYMGGSAMGLYYLLKEMRGGEDPLAPENILALFAGIMTGAPISGQSRLTATAKSPLTGCIGDSECGGFFPAELKFAGFDGIVLRGAALSPVYLWVHEGQAELRSAEHLWGKQTGEVEAILKDELGDPRIQVLQTGPAGESGVRYSALINMCSRANGRTGIGAVMGSKALKAVVVRGSSRLQLADPSRLNQLARWGRTALPESDVAGLGKYGTAQVTGGQQVVGGLPSYNYRSGVFEGWEAVDGPTLYDTRLRGAAEGKQDRLGRDSCYACAVRCKRVVEIPEGPYQTSEAYGGPEYETISVFGSYCGIGDLDAIIKANEICNRYGLDTITCGATIAWAMECFEAGLLTTNDTGGIALKFGDAEAMVRMTEMIARREGFGRLLGEGSQRAAAAIGRGTERYLITSKGLEAPAHMPQTKRSLALIYAVNPFGADHESSEHDPSYAAYPERMAMLGLTNPQPALSLNAEKVRYALVTQHLYSALDTVGACAFVFGPAWHLFGPDQLADALQSITGWEVSVEEILQVGERRLNMMRAFNAREGIGREADTLPTRFFARPLEGGPTEGLKVDHAEWCEALDTYYRLSGWDQSSGQPTRAKLESLGISWIADLMGQGETR